MRPTLMIAVLSALGALSVNAQEAEERWAGNVEFGLAVTSGNTESETLNGRVDVEHARGPWIFEGFLAGVRAKSDDEISANRYELGGKLGHAFGERAYAFGSMRYERDDFGPNQHQVIASAGAGYRFVDSERSSLVGEIGPGTRWFQPANKHIGTPPVLIARGTETDSIIRGSLRFEHQLTPAARLTNALLAESGGGATQLRNDLALRVRMSERLALQASYQTRHATAVLQGIEKTDTLLTTNLVLGF